ncbi:hypothetical protein LVD15_02180 [Fulvivirga maritima]|uniref:hypothetical protein n=1 Tax=Fulvivirga maritima TaxID=2904247 RepID=UPI001F27492D|nr:hypothetical protein [Fulvivirga maritima]UII27259.1 hypothetical protein LVD15_02180 [Fulvivirga maritima]
MFKGILSLTLVLFFVSQAIKAQDINPQGQFLEDTIKIGSPIGFSLSVKHPRSIDVVFPDSLYDFSPYEIDHKLYFPTKSDSLISYDSAVYYLTSFEIDSIQTLKLPVFALHGNDSTTIYSNTDSVILQQLVKEVPDSLAVEELPLKENTTYKPVEFAFNYPYLIVGLAIFIVVAIISIIVFGGKVKKFFKIKRLKKAYESFVQQYDSVVTDQSLSTSKQAEKVLIIWKRYLEQLEKQPYTKLTTKEIIKRYQPKGIEDSLTQLDMAIYNPKAHGELMPAYTSLKKYSNERYTAKVEEVKND